MHNGKERTRKDIIININYQDISELQDMAVRDNMFYQSACFSICGQTG